ncbi:MAG: YafY family protein [Acidobacteriota bacterium]|jgi:predicted DNA-binding transcriptional regulator YafY
MRRADRLFQIIQLLRVRDTMTGAELADELEVSVRTIYRDIRDLMANGVAIDGEAGVGYMLRQGFDLPPLMFTGDEIEALVAGARMVEAWGDDDLARQARSVLSKAESVLPENLRERLRGVDIYAPSFHVPETLTENMGPLRRAIATRRKIRFAYENQRGDTSERTARPLGLTFWGSTWTAACWCELREDFRNFRTDRMRELIVLEDPIPDEPGRDLAAFLRQVEAEGDDEA